MKSPETITSESKILYSLVIQLRAIENKVVLNYVTQQKMVQNEVGQLWAADIE